MGNDEALASERSGFGALGLGGPWAAAIEQRWGEEGRIRKVLSEPLDRHEEYIVDKITDWVQRDGI